MQGIAHRAMLWLQFSHFTPLHALRFQGGGSHSTEETTSRLGSPETRATQFSHLKEVSHWHFPKIGALWQLFQVQRNIINMFLGCNLDALKPDFPSWVSTWLDVSDQRGKNSCSGNSYSKLPWLRSIMTFINHCICCLLKGKKTILWQPLFKE